MKKIALYITLGIIVLIIGILTFIIALPSIIANSDAEWEKRYNKYFEKVDYEFSGKIKSFIHIGGSRSLIKIEIDDIQIDKNEIQNDDDFVGLYDNKNNIIIMFNTFSMDFYDINKDKLWIDIVRNSTIGKEIEVERLNVRVISKERKIYYEQVDNKDTILIHFPTVYSKYLKQKEHEMGNVIRF